MKRLALTLVALAVLLASPATAGAKAPRDMIPLRTAVTFTPASAEFPCPAAACAYPNGNIVVAAGVQLATFAKRHETFHAWEATHLTDSDRGFLTSIIPGARGLQWYLEHGASNAAGELAADAYASCDLGRYPNGGPWETSYGYTPTMVQHSRVCAALFALSVSR